MPNQKMLSITGRKPRNKIRTFSKRPKHKLKNKKQSKPLKKRKKGPKPRQLKTWSLNIIMTMSWVTGDN